MKIVNYYQEYRNNFFVFYSNTTSLYLLNQYCASYLNFLYNNKILFTINGRVISYRQVGKLLFLDLYDIGYKIQIFVNQHFFFKIPFFLFNSIKLGSFLNVKGYLIKTSSNELSIFIINLKILNIPLAFFSNKYHKLASKYLIYSKRYVDLIFNKKNKFIFKIRSKIINFIRQYFNKNFYKEVETPMLNFKIGGAFAKPFVTYCNILDTNMSLRIAPELYLKKLLVGGLDRIYEINKNFRNESVSSTHNPEFTSLEFYNSYSNYIFFLKFTEIFFFLLIRFLTGTYKLISSNISFNFSYIFYKISFIEIIFLFNFFFCYDFIFNFVEIFYIAKQFRLSVFSYYTLGKIQSLIFEKFVEYNLYQPTFVINYPASISPLSKKNKFNYFFSSRFELFIYGKEFANGFSELNSVFEQISAFKHQTLYKTKINQEYMDFDISYIDALEFGMPPSAGQGIGIDRLIMLITNSTKIREVIFFPLFKK